MKKKVIFLFIFVMMLFPSMVLAECSEEQISNLKKLSENIKFDYELNKEKNYSLKFYNIPDTLFLNDETGFDYYTNKDTKDYYKPGFKYSFFVMSNNNDCKFKIIDKLKIDFPELKKPNQENMIAKYLYYYIAGGIVLVATTVFVVLKIRNKKKEVL